MTRLARRNRTKRIKLWKKRGLVYRNGHFWRPMKWQVVVPMWAKGVY